MGPMRDTIYRGVMTQQIVFIYFLKKDKKMLKGINKVK